MSASRTFRVFTEVQNVATLILDHPNVPNVLNETEEFKGRA